MTRTKALSAALLLVALACKKESESTATYTPPPTAPQEQTATTETIAAGPLATPPGPTVTLTNPGSTAHVALTPDFTTPPGMNPQEATRLTLDAVQQEMTAGDVLIVDVRDPEAYNASHAKGAVNVPFHELAQRMGELPKEKFLVTYCT